MDRTDRGGGPAAVTSSELLSVVASRELAARRTVFAGIGLPTLATELARLTVAPTPGPDRALAEGIRPLGVGVTRVITEPGVLAREGVGAELRLVAVHPGVTVAQVRAATGWDLKAAASLGTVPPPTGAELRPLREDVAPERVHLR